MKKNKLIYISSVAVPTQIKLCYEMQNYFDAEFWFYEELGDRPEWWRFDLGPKCKVLKNVFFKKYAKYLTFSHIKMLNTFNPDILMLGGFIIPANILAYIWAKNNNKKTIIFTERSRDKYGKLRKNSIIWKLIKLIYKKLDLILVSADDIVDQFSIEFKFKNKIFGSQYPSDIDSFLTHKLRYGTNINNINILFPNRLTEIYNPIMVLDVFIEIQKVYPESKLFLNSDGELKNKCIKYIKKNCIKNIFFIENLKSWNELHNIYLNCQIMFLPANFSNGNFTIIEAMASGMGIIISNKILGSGKFINNKKNGFVCENNKESYINAFQEYFKYPEIIIKHGIINKKIVNKYSIKDTAILYREQINTIL